MDATPNAGLGTVREWMSRSPITVSPEHSVEQVIRLPHMRPGGLLAMLGAALEEVWGLNAPYAVVLVSSQNRRLESLALKMGFEPYAETEDGRWYVRYRP